MLNKLLKWLNGPDIVDFGNGYKEWYLNGKLHRKNGPAVDFGNGHKEWYLNGKLHREDGPAIEYSDGRKGWYLNGEKVTEETVRKLGKMK